MEKTSRYQELRIKLLNGPSTWLITGVAGFIGSNLLEELLLLNQDVVGLDNFSTGNQNNLDDVRSAVPQEHWKRFRFIKGDIQNIEICFDACKGVDYVLHQAALGSVPRSLKDPIATNNTNISGFLNMLIAAKDSSVKSFTYAASSSTYGDHSALPKKEDIIGQPLSPYAVTKYVNELYAHVFSLNYNFHSTGLRYFNVFGKRQDPNGAYAAVIPKWISAMMGKEKIYINGDGSTSRDFCHINNAVQANILAATQIQQSKNNIFNIAVGDRTSLNELYSLVKSILQNSGYIYGFDPTYKDFREGDVKHSQADISKAQNILGYSPLFNIRDGLEESINWYVNNKHL